MDYLMIVMKMSKYQQVWIRKRGKFIRPNKELKLNEEYKTLMKK